MAIQTKIQVIVDAASAAKQLDAIKTSASGTEKAFGMLKAAAASLTAAMSIGAIAKVGEDSQRANIALKTLTATHGELEQAQTSINRITAVLGDSTLEATQGFTKFYGALRETGMSVNQLEVLYVGLNKAAALSGASSEEAAAATMQLKQAFASGRLQGDELRSVLENMPAFTSALTKETDRLGLTTNGTAADLRELGKEGKLTSDILFNAAKSVATATAPSKTAAEQLRVAFTNLSQKIAEAFGPTAIAVIQRFTAAVTVIGNWFSANRETIGFIVNLMVRLGAVIGPMAGVIYTIVKAYQIWTATTKALAAAKAFLLALSGPQGIGLVAAAAGAAAIGIAGMNAVLDKTDEETKKAAAAANQGEKEFKEMAAGVDGMPPKVNAAEQATNALKEKAKEVKAEFEAAGQAIENGAKKSELARNVEGARLDAARELNNLQQQQLQKQYEMATTAQQRYDIAVKMFQTSVEGARLEYQQQLLNNQAAIQNAQTEAQKVELKYKQIEAERALAIQRGESTTAIDHALRVQGEAVAMAQEAISAQQQIAQYQNEGAKYAYEGKVLAAEKALSDKLSSEQIGLSAEAAQQVASSYGQQASTVGTVTSNMEQQASSSQQSSMYIQQSTSAAGNLANATGGVANAASAAAGSYANLAAQANAAAAAIAKANAARSSGGGGGGGGKAAAEGAYWKGGFKAFAKGGVVNGPTMGLVGEGGESEYIIPASKMQGAMERYGQGRRGESVIPTSVNPQVNVTTGPVMNMNNSNYVSMGDFQSGMKKASEQGAMMAMQTMRGNSRIKRNV